MLFKLHLFICVFIIGVSVKSQSFVVGHNNIPYASSNNNESNSSAAMLGSRIYNTFTGWQSGFSAFNIKKTDLSGNILFWRQEANINNAAPSKLFSGNNLLYYICKNQLTVLDTNLSIKNIYTYTTGITNNAWYFNDGLVAQNGDVVLVGASANYASNTFFNIKALVVRLNPLNGNLIYSKTYTNTTLCMASCVTENTVSSSLFVSGRVMNNGYSTFLLNITNDNLGNLNSSKYFMPSTSEKNLDVRKMIILNNSLYLFARDSAAKLVVTKTNVNLTNTFQTKYYSNFIYCDATKNSTNNGFYINGYGPRTYTAVPLSIVQLDTLLNATKSILYPTLVNKYDSLSNFSLDYYAGLNGAYSNFGASVFDKFASVFSISNKSILNSTAGAGNTNQYLVKEATTLNGSCLNNFNLLNSTYAYNIAPTTFTASNLSVTGYTQAAIISNIIPTVAVACGTIVGIANSTDINAPKIYTNQKIIYFTNSDLKNSVFEIYNLAGQKVLNTTLNNNQKQLDVNKLPSGIYLYKIYYNGLVYSKKIMIE